MHRKETYLLQGVFVGKVCGYADYGKPLSPSTRKHRPRAYAYYRCVGRDGYRFGGQRVWANTPGRTELVEMAVWHEVCPLRNDPQRLEREYHRRGHAHPRGAKGETAESLRAQMTKLQRGMARVIAGYAEGVSEKGEVEPRIKKIKPRGIVLEDQLQQLADAAVQQRELRVLIGQLEECVTQGQRHLATADWEMKREVIRALVRRVEIDKQEVTVVFRVGPDPHRHPPEKKSSQHCWGRNFPRAV
jgi:site-specific DNA recombinase